MPLTLLSAQMYNIILSYILPLVDRFDGQLILPYMTPEQLGMEDEDIIDVFVSKPSETGKRTLDDGEDQQGDRKRGM